MHLQVQTNWNMEMLVFRGGGTAGGLREESTHRKTETTQPTYAKIEPGPYWLEACTFATVPTLLPQAIT